MSFLLRCATTAHRVSFFKSASLYAAGFLRRRASSGLDFPSWRCLHLAFTGLLKANFYSLRFPPLRSQWGMCAHLGLLRDFHTDCTIAASKPPPTPLALSPACLLRRQLIEPRRPCCPAASPAASAEQRPGLLRHQPITPGRRTAPTIPPISGSPVSPSPNATLSRSRAHHHLRRLPSPYHPTPSITRLSLDAAIPPRPTDPTPSVLSGCPPYPTTPFSASGPFAFAVFHTSPEFWMVLQFLAPVFDTRLEF